jgi:hypothetical protein
MLFPGPSARSHSLGDKKAAHSPEASDDHEVDGGTFGGDGLEVIEVAGHCPDMERLKGRGFYEPIQKQLIEKFQWTRDGRRIPHDNDIDGVNDSKADTGKIPEWL